MSGKSPTPHRKAHADKSGDTSPTGSRESSPKGSKKQLSVGSPKGSKKELLETKTSPLTTHRNPSTMANPSGSLQKEETLKSWEIRGLKEITWKRAHGKHWHTALVRFVHGVMSGYATDEPGQLPEFEIKMDDIRDHAVVIAVDDEHLYVLKCPAVEGDWVLLSFSSAETATKMLSRADPDRFPKGMVPGVKEAGDHLQWKISVISQEKDGHMVYDIVAHSPNDLPGDRMRLHCCATYNALHDEHQRACKTIPEAKALVFPPSRLFPSKDPDFIQQRCIDLRAYFSHALREMPLMLFWRNNDIFQCHFG